ncbi:Pre-mRNA-splicing factor cwf16 [Malassezia nana]|uniref:Splicing factor YJU2 n=1 Tax=Malassezia nana TaxID=180528 RepID=A0AAF0EEX4_9BASI|nr:Pre-mRNA-splicing factor cwf16 [Malassezia nana]
MSERKVLQKYYPPDYDPSAIRRGRTGGGKQKTVRLMAPFSMRCNTCGEYIYRGKKFNARKETVNNDDYYGIPIFRFYIKCSQCSSEITFKTDPKNSDYAAEHGAQRNFEPWREKEEDKVPSESDKEGEGEEEEEDIDPMKALEKRMDEAQREMEVMDALQDIRTRNARFERVDTSAVLDSIAQNKRPIEATADDAPETNDEDEALVRKYFPKGPVAPLDPSDDGPAPSDTTKEAAAPAEAPSATSLLSESSRQQLQSLPVSASVPRPSAKRRRGPNALGIVRRA